MKLQVLAWLALAINGRLTSSIDWREAGRDTLIGERYLASTLRGGARTAQGRMAFPRAPQWPETGIQPPYLPGARYNGSTGLQRA